MWKRPSIIPTIDRVEVYHLNCGCTVTLINNTIKDEFTLLNTYKVSRNAIAGIKWALDIKNYCLMNRNIPVEHIDPVELRKKYTPDPVKSMQVFHILTTAQYGGKT